jgi:antitoxin VapB
MPLHIRDNRALELARRLSEARGETMTEVVVEALEEALKRERERQPLGRRLDDIARRLAEDGDPAKARKPNKAEIDALWGNE